VSDRLGQEPFRRTLTAIGAASGVFAGSTEGEGRALATGGFGEDLAGVAFTGLDRDGDALAFMGGAPELD
jgi:hypothetical protein